MPKRKKKESEIEWNTNIQYYKGVPLTLIPYAPIYYAQKNAKRFQLGERKFGQNIWIPNVYLEPDGSLKIGVNIDFAMRIAIRQKKFQYAHLDPSKFIT